MEARATQRNIRQSARKLRMVCDLIRGKDLDWALNALHFSKRKSSIQVEKTLRSAVSNLLNTDEGGHLEPEDLCIKTIFVNEGPTARRFRPRAMGRATIIRKRSSHMTVVVADKNDRKTK